MPRKPKPPLTNLHIESLSTGAIIGLVDDFTGEAIAQQPRSVPPTSDAYAQQRSKQREAATQRVLTQAQQVLKAARWGQPAQPRSQAQPFKRRF